MQRISRPALGSGDERSPQRRCIVTGEVRDRAGLLRFVVGPNGEIVPDIEARLPGRGLWVIPVRDIVARAVAKRVFARAARQSVTACPELPNRVEGLLTRRCCDGLGLARRAGSAVAGFDRVAETVRRGEAALLLLALDAGDNGRGKLVELADGLSVARVLRADELGAAFGRDRIVHVGIGGGPLCRRLLLDFTRLAGFRLGAAVNVPRDDRGSTPGHEKADFAPARPATQDGGTEAHG